MNNGSVLSIPGYRIERILGKGGMATVYLATQMSLGRAVALKVLNDPETPQFFERFLNEGRFVSRLSHSNLVTIYDIGQGDGFYYIAMEYLPDGDLKSRIVQGVKPAQALKIIGKLAACLSYVHSQGVIHRDIKPSNILFRSDDTPVLTDFGIAKLIQMDNDLTITGTILGSPHYLSPEQAQSSEALDGRADLYSLGIILFEMLTGRKPFNGTTFAATLMAHIKEPIPRLPEQFTLYQPIVDKLLAKSPQDRFQSGTELIMSLQQLKSRGRQRRSRPEGANDEKAESAKSEQIPVKPAKSRLPWITWAGSAVLLAIATTFFVNSVDQNTPMATTPVNAQEQSLAIPAPEDIVLPQSAADSPEESTPLEEDDQRIDTEESGTSALSAAETEPADTPGDDPQSRIAWLLERAETCLKQNRLTRPTQDNAHRHYLTVLELQPDNQQAQRGLQRIAGRYVLLARHRLEQERLPSAQRLISAGLSVVPDHEELNRLQAEMQTRLAAPAPVREPEPQIITPQVEQPPSQTPPKRDYWERMLTPDRG